MPFSGQVPAPQCLPCHLGPKVTSGFEVQHSAQGAVLSLIKWWQCKWIIQNRLKAEDIFFCLDIYFLLIRNSLKLKSSHPTMESIKKFGCTSENAVSTAQFKESRSWEMILLSTTPCAGVSRSLSQKILKWLWSPALCWAVRMKTMCRIRAVLTIQSLAFAGEPGPFEHSVVHMLLKVSVSSIDLARLHTAWQHKPDLGKK